MPLTPHALKVLTNRFTFAFKNMYLMDDPSLVITVGSTLNDYSANIRGTVREVSYGGNPGLAYGTVSYNNSHITFANGKATATSTSNTTTNPLLYAFPASTMFHCIVFTDENATELSRVIRGIIDIPVGQRPNLTEDGAYYIRQIKINLGNV